MARNIQAWILAITASGSLLAGCHSTAPAKRDGAIAAQRTAVPFAANGQAQRPQLFAGSPGANGEPTQAPSNTATANRGAGNANQLAQPTVPHGSLQNSVGVNSDSIASTTATQSRMAPASQVAAEPLAWNTESDPFTSVPAAGSPAAMPAQQVTLSTEQADYSVSLQTPGGEAQVPPNEPSAAMNTERLELVDVVRAVDAAFPLLYSAFLQQQIAAGNNVAAQGAFDLNLKGSTTSQGVGFYENYGQSLGLQRQLWNSGTSVYGGYRLGDGQFEPWYKERETNEGGEFTVGTVIPLRKNRLIDAQRGELFKTGQDVAAADPFIQAQRNLFIRDAAIAYWDWVDAGNLMQIQRRLLQLAKDRAQQIELKVAQGDLPKLANIDNQRLIAQRETKLIDTTRKFQATSIKLSLFLRDLDGQPMLADESYLPQQVSAIEAQAFESLDRDIATAIAQHPEIRELDFEINKAQIDVQLAQNSVLGKLDFFIETSQDVGSRASSLGDKSPLEVEAGLMGELPLQRRAGLGKVTATQGKLQQWELKRRFLADKISTAVRDSYSAYLNAADRLNRALTNYDLALQALEIGRQQFTAGNIDLIILNIYEQALADAEILVIESRIAIQQAFVDYQFALGSPLPQ